jgi:uncharacterized protein with PIN domain
MKTISKIAALVFAISLIAGVNVFAQEHSHTHKDGKKGDHKLMDAKEIDKNKDGSLFQCSMNPDQMSDEPGDCSKCGMKLSKVSIEEANKNLEEKGMKKEGMHEMNHDKMMKEHKGMMDHDKMSKDGKHSMDHSKMKHSGMDNAIERTGLIDVETIDKNKDGKVYQDMMDWNVISDKAGDCPECGMKLKEVSLDEAKQNLVEHGYKVK